MTLFVIPALAGEKEISLSDLEDKGVSLQDLNPLNVEARSYDNPANRTLISGYLVTSFRNTDNGFPDAFGNETVFGADPAGTQEFGFNKLAFGINKRFSDYAWVAAALEMTTLIEGGKTQIETELDVGNINLMAPIGNGLIVTLGKFNSPISFEQEDAPFLLQATQSLTYQFASPVKMTGLMLTYPFSINLEARLIGFNGWQTDGDNNDAKSLAFQLGYAPVYWVNTRFSYIVGAELNDNSRDLRQVFDLAATLNPGNWLIGLEAAYGREENQSLVNPGDSAEWVSGQITLHYDFVKYFGLTGRYSFLADFDGRADIEAAHRQKRTMNEITFAPIFHISPDFLGYLGMGMIPQSQHLISGIDVRFEYRYDWVNETGPNTIFEGKVGNPVNNRHSFIVELVARF
jgi:putative OmpL-like beta-barrel porin-2